MIRRMEFVTNDMYQLPPNSWYAGQFTGMSNTFVNLTNNLTTLPPLSSLTDAPSSSLNNSTSNATSPQPQAASQSVAAGASTATGNLLSVPVASPHSPPVDRNTSTSAMGGSNLTDLAGTDPNASTSNPDDDTTEALANATSHNDGSLLLQNSHPQVHHHHHHHHPSIEMMSVSNPLISGASSLTNSFGSQLYAAQFPSAHSFTNGLHGTSATSSFTPPTPPSPSTMSASNQSFGQLTFASTPIYERFSVAAAAAAYNSFPSPSYSVGAPNSMMSSTSCLELNRTCSQTNLSNENHFGDLSGMSSNLNLSMPMLSHSSHQQQLQHQHHLHATGQLLHSNTPSSNSSSTSSSTSVHLSSQQTQQTSQPMLHSQLLDAQQQTHQPQQQSSITMHHAHLHSHAMQQTASHPHPHHSSQQLPFMSSTHNSQLTANQHHHHHHHSLTNGSLNHSHLSGSLSDDSQAALLNIHNAHLLSIAHVKKEDPDDDELEADEDPSAIGLHQPMVTGASSNSSSSPSRLPPLSSLTGQMSNANGDSNAPFDWMKKAQYTSQPQPGKTRTRDKYRVVYSDTQRLELEKEFYSARYITIRRKSELASMLGLSERQVKIWFQNRRAKDRKQFKKHRDDSCFKPPPMSNAGTPLTMLSPIDPSSLVMSAMPSIN